MARRKLWKLCSFISVGVLEPDEVGRDLVPEAGGVSSIGALSTKMVGGASGGRHV